MPDTTSRPTVATEGGLHRDGDKPRLVDMIPPELLLESGRIFAQNNAPRPGYTEGKYPDIDGRPNFRAGIQTTKLLDSMLRHLLALAVGEDTDPDSGFDHCGHILCNLSMLWWMRQHRPDLDNRDWSGPATSPPAEPWQPPGYDIRYPVAPCPAPPFVVGDPCPQPVPITCTGDHSPDAPPATVTGEPLDLRWANVGRGGGSGDPRDW